MGSDITAEQTVLKAKTGQYSYRSRAKEFIELHDQIQTSVNLLDSLEGFLSTFQNDLSTVSGQISELQDRSKDIENRLKSRRRIERPLSSLISEFVIPPSLATLVLDSEVGEPWITAIDDFERRLETTMARTRVKAARDLGEVAEGLRIVAATKLRGYFLTLFQPIRNSVTTNMQVIQTSVLLKYSPLFAFLQRQAPNVAQEVQRLYVGAARMYYETGFRRYARSLGWIKARSVDKFETIVAMERGQDLQYDQERLSFGKIEGPGVTLAYMADDKTHKEPIEGLLRSFLLVFMDNATAEYTFVKAFFSVEALVPPGESANIVSLPTTLLSPDRGTYVEQQSATGSDYDGHRNIPSANPRVNGSSIAASLKEEQVNSDAIWKQVMDPVLEYCQTFVRSTLEPVPPTISLLTIIRLTEDVVVEVQRRNSPPVESFVFGLRLQMWPIFQKSMTEHVDALKKLAEGTNSGYFSRAPTITDAGVSMICNRYAVFFNSFISLTEQEEETMIFSNLLRLRLELSKLIVQHSSHLKDIVARSTAQSMIYEALLQSLSRGAQLSAHPKSQQEIAYWSNLEEEAKRKIVSATHSRTRQQTLIST